MGKSKKPMSLATKLFVTGCIFLVASLVVLFLSSALQLIPWNETTNNVCWGVQGGTGWFWGTIFQIGFEKQQWYNMDIWRFFLVVILLVTFILSIVSIIVDIAKKEFKKIPEVVILYFAILYAGYLFISIWVPLSKGVLWRSAYYAYILVFVLDLVAIVLLAVPAITVANKALDKYTAAKEEPVKEEKVEEQPVVAGVDEDAVRSIVVEEIEKHVEEKHNAEEPAKEEPVAEEKVEEPVEEEKAEEPVAEETPEEPVAEEDDEEAEEEGEEEVAEEGAADPKFPTKSKRRRASFETRVKKSDEDIRHKYYELRDYIRSYGVSDRISIPGHTFSAHRERYVFVTIVGKRIKAYYALDPKDYVESPIPVEAVDSKKYEDLPCMLRIKSGLSLRRAMKLVDDVMAAKGVEKPEAK